MYGQVKFIKVVDKNERFIMNCVGDNAKALELCTCFQSDTLRITDGVAVIKLKVEKAS